MTHYAFLDINNVVVEVITGKDEGEDGVDWEAWYGKFRGQTCKRTSPEASGGQNPKGVPFRKNYAGIGNIYDPARDAFYFPKPQGSYTFDESDCSWVRDLKLETVDGNVIISADGVDFVTVFFVGASELSLQHVSINGELLEVLTDEFGRGEFELATDTSGLIVIEWNGLSLEIASI